MNGLMPASIRGSVAACALLLFAWPAASAPRQADARPSASRQPVSAVVVEVSVTDPKGGAVPGLGPADFVVTVDGQPREVISARRSGTFGDDRPAAGAGEPAADVRQAAPGRRFVSNEQEAAGRLVLVAVDEGTVTASGLRQVTGPIGALLAGLGTSDRVGLAVLPAARMLVTFTRDTARVLDGLATIGGSGAWSGAASGYRLSVLEAYGVSRGDARISDGVVRRECALFMSDLDQARCPDAVRAEARRLVADAGGRARQLGEAIGRLVAGLERSGAPATLLLVSDGVASPEAPQLFQALGPAVSAAGVSIQVLRPGPSGPEFERAVTFAADDRTAAAASLETLAGIGGGEVHDVAGSGESSVGRLVAALASIYQVVFEAGASDCDGKPHRLDVSSARPGLTVRSRPTLIARPESAGGAERLARLLQSPVPASGLPVRVTAFSLADEVPGQVRVLVAGEIDRDQAAPGSALVGFAVISAAGQAVASQGRQVTMAVGPSRRLAYTGGVSVAPGRYTLRFAAIRGSRIGSVELAIEARLASAGSLRVGDLVLGEPPPPGGAIVPPVDGRLRGDRIVGYLQIGHEPGARDDLVLDIVTREDAPALVSVPFSITPSGARATAIQVSLDVSLLPPGDYGVRLSVPAAGATSVEGYAPFSLERVPRDRRRSAATPSGRSGAPGVREEPRAIVAPTGRTPQPEPKPVRVAPGRVLEPEVLGPFLDELRERAPATAYDAIERARSGRFREALAGLPAGSGTDPVEPFLRGLAWLSENRPQEASDAFREAVRAAPDFLTGAFYLGACYAAGGRTTQAINAWQTSLIGLDRFPGVYRVLGDTLLAAGEADRALAVLRRGAEKWPENRSIGGAELRAAFDAGELDVAIEAAGRLAGLADVDPDLLFLGMQAAFEAAFTAEASGLARLGDRIRHLQDRYVAAGGPRQALVAEWVAFVEARARGASRVAARPPEGRTRGLTGREQGPNGWCSGVFSSCAVFCSLPGRLVRPALQAAIDVHQGLPGGMARGVADTGCESGSESGSGIVDSGADAV